MIGRRDFQLIFLGGVDEAILTTQVIRHAITVTQHWPTCEIPVLCELGGDMQMLVISMAVLSLLRLE